MTTETTLATLPKEKSVEQNSTQTTVEDIKQVTQSSTAQANRRRKQLKEKPVSKPAKSTAAKAGAAKAE
jgi:hypothetical protein